MLSPARSALLVLTLPLFALPGTAFASSTGTDELLSTIEMVPPVVIFVVDLSADMTVPCDGSGVGDSCLTDTLQAIDQVARHFDWAQYGVVGTVESDTDAGFYEIAPVGSSYAEISSALSSVTAWGTNVRNLGEALQAVTSDYLSLAATNDDVNDDGDAFTGDWDESPLVYSCTEIHLIVLSKDRPSSDDQIGFAYGSASNTEPGEVSCTAAGLGSPDEQCMYDNVAAHVYNTDWSSLSGTQRATTHTIGLNVGTGSIADALFDNASTNTAGDGVYYDAADGSEILTGILSVLYEIQAGYYTRSTPVVSADGAYLLYTYYELTGSDPLAQGHVRAYAVDTDDSSATYGQVLYEGPSAYGGAVWDGGDLLVSRIVTFQDFNADDRDGFGHRDIYTYEDAAAALPALAAEFNSTGRIGIDIDFSTAVGASAAVLDLYLDTTVDPSNSPCALDDAYDLDDDCVVDGDDLNELLDFARGLPTAEYRYLEMERGRWKLGDAPYSVPVIVSARNDVFTTDVSYRRFIESLEDDGVPSIVITTNNDGMLHAFALEDDPDTSTDDEAGQELWAWLPGYLLLRDHPQEWANNLIDLMWYGKTFLFDGTPVVEDVWIDNAGGVADGIKESDGSEWHRVVVAQQGLGGPVTLALDITDPAAPIFLWEQTNETDTTAQGYTTGRPTIFNLYDATDPTDPHDQWVAMWGGGRAVGYTGASGTAYYESSEATLYMWNVGDDVTGMETVGYSDAGDNIGTLFPDHVSQGGSETTPSLNYSGGGPNFEYGYISAALTVVDVDGDGDGDVVYFPVTSSYRPTDEGGLGVTDPEDPGSSWIYKAILDTADPDDLEWCKWYDPNTGTDGSNGIGARPEVYYAATASWRSNGTLGVYWGTGTPFSRDGSEDGYFFAMYDEDPLDCTSTAQPIPCNGNDGYYPLEAGEGLTSDPLVYAGVVYFTTYVPDIDRCEMGNGRVYALRFDDCSPGMDTDGDGEATVTDQSYIETEGYVGGVSVSSQGTVLYGTANPTVDGTSAALETFGAATDPFLGTAAIAWMEIY